MRIEGGREAQLFYSLIFSEHCCSLRSKNWYTRKRY